MPRSEAVRRIKFGQVQVGGTVVHDPGMQLTAGKDVVWRGLQVRPYGHLHVMLHKPAGLVSSTEESDGPSVLSVLPESLRHKDLAPIGRLDKDTTGLLLLTTDGGVQHLLTHPKRHLDKQYLVQLAEPLPADAAERFAAGIVLADGTVCQPAALWTDGLQARVVLREGKYHQVKRMIAACGSAVVGLHRERIGPLWLPSNLPAGSARRLTDAELAELMDTITDGKAWPGGPVVQFPPAPEPTDA